MTLCALWYDNGRASLWMETTGPMDFPAGTHDIGDAKRKLSEAYAAMERHLKLQIDSLAGSGLADKRLLAVAWTDIEKGFMAIQKSMHHGDGREYAKVDMPTPMPEFNIPTGDPQRFSDDQSSERSPDPKQLDDGRNL